LNPLRRAFGGALFAALVLAASARRANGAVDTAVQLEYRADEAGGCVGEDELRRMVINQLGHDPFSPDADRRVRITIARSDAGFQGRIVWTEADGRPLGERVLSSRSRDCHEIAANVAFAVVLQLQLVERGAPNDGADGGADAERPSEKTGDETIAPRPPRSDRASPRNLRPGPFPRHRLRCGSRWARVRRWASA